MDIKRKKAIRRLCAAGMCLAMAMVLPFLTGQIPEIGKSLAPMHLPAFLCGFVAGPVWGLIVGFCAPLLRNLIFHMPALSSAIPMAFELAGYGLTAGILYRILPKKLPYIYVSLGGAMIVGRFFRAIVKAALLVADNNALTLKIFFAGMLTNAIPGIICQIVIIPLVIFALRKAGLTDAD